MTILDEIEWAGHRVGDVRECEFLRRIDPCDDELRRRLTSIEWVQRVSLYRYSITVTRTSSRAPWKTVQAAVEAVIRDTWNTGDNQ